MSEIREQLATAQENHVAKNEKSKQLSELSKLKAENHRLKMINQMLSDDNYKMKRAAQGQELRIAQQTLELEFATECGTDDKFDWNTLKFIPANKK